MLGVTQGESACRLFRALQPKSMQDCVFATAMIRPVAMSGRQKAAMFQDWSQEAVQDSIVFEDDAIDIISNIIGVDMYEADMYRRAFAKKNDEKILEFVEKMGGHPRKQEAMAALPRTIGSRPCRVSVVGPEDLPAP